MKVAVVGSRTLSGPVIFAKIMTYLRDLDPEKTWIISGGADGVDTEAELAAKTIRCRLLLIIPDWKLGKHAGFLRNTDIAKESDAVFCVWDGKSRGCIDTVMKAIAMKKPVTVERSPCLAG